MNLVDLRRLAVAVLGLAVVMLVSGCPYENQRSAGNGLSGTLYLEPAAHAANLCGSSPAELVCEYRSCWMQNAGAGMHELQISRRVEFKSGNGLGDNSRCMDYQALGAEDRLVLGVLPEGAATIGSVEVCADAVRFELTLEQPGELQLSIATAPYSDHWDLSVVDDCQDYVCKDSPGRPGPGQCGD